MGMRWLKKYMAWVLLLVYWPALFVLTHLPRLPAPDIRGSDKIAHFTAYLALTILFWLARYGRRRPSLHGRTIYYVLLLMLCYGVVDEISQQWVPNRFADWVDWLANTAGVVMGLFIVTVLRKWWHGLVVYWLGMFVLTHVPTKTQPLDFLPEQMQEFRLVYLMAGYVALSLLWWRSWCPQGRFVLNRMLFISTLLVLPTYALLDVMLTWVMRQPFDVSALLTAVGGIILGIGCAAAFAQQHVTTEAESV